MIIIPDEKVGLDELVLAPVEAKEDENKDDSSNEMKVSVKVPANAEDVRIICYKGDNLIQMHQFGTHSKRISESKSVFAHGLPKRFGYCRQGMANVWIMKELTNKAFYVKCCKGLQTAVVKIYFEPYEINGEVCGIIYISGMTKEVTINSQILNNVKDYINQELIHVDDLVLLFEKLQFHGEREFDRLQICFKKKFSKRKEAKNWCYHCGFHIKLTRYPKCAQCKVAKYCSYDCQKADWKNHREFCNGKRLIIQKKNNYNYLHDWY